MNNHTELHIHPIERIWIIISFAMIGVFAIAVLTAGFAYGFQLPVPEDRVVDPNLVATPGATAFGEPGLRELSPGNMEARILAQTWSFSPKEITVPVGTKVTFFVTTKDVQHGFHLEGSNINFMVLPGQISKLSTTFNTPGTYNFYCHEYCGVGHQTMYGQVIVTP
ncbi:MAG TPA: cytochrome c oxidase subunit II [Anaerolineales bacterium]|nr:cytochrome c oxidase subunit II [Anaerolineales bacterium]